jgi:hypothetical protein
VWDTRPGCSKPSRIYDEQLVDGFIGAAAGLAEKLNSGIRVADTGCGTGHAVNLLA